jgi:hypothetical protein
MFDPRAALKPTVSSKDGQFDVAGRSIAGLLIVIAALALLTNFLFFAHFDDFYSPDSVSYIAPASNLLAGHGFTNSIGEPETVRTPGYSLLALPFLWTGLDLKYLVILQHLINLFLAVATAAITLQLTGSRRQSVIAGTLLCIDLPMLEAANKILTETFFTAILAISLWLLWIATNRSQKRLLPVLGAGFLSGFAALVRPVGLFFFIPVIVYLLLVRPKFRWQAVLGFVMAFACLPLAWAARNYHQTGYFVVSSLSGSEMLGFRAAGALAVNDPGDFFRNLEMRQRQLLNQACNEMGRPADDCTLLNISQKSGLQKSKVYMRIGTRVVLNHPVAYLKVAIQGAARLMLGGGADRFGRMTGLSQQTAGRILLLYTLPCFCLALTGLVSWWTKNRQLCYLAVLVMIYFVGLAAGAESHARYRVPVIPFYSIMIASGADLLLRRVLPVTQKSQRESLSS